MKRALLNMKKLSVKDLPNQDALITALNGRGNSPKRENQEGIKERKVQSLKDIIKISH